MSRNKYDKVNPLVSVVVPTHNRRDWLPITLESLLKQTYKDIEIVVVNDAGESVKDIVSSFNNISTLTEKIKYIEHSKNSGLAASRNTGMENASGNYFIFLDDDDILLPLSVEFRLSQMKKLNAEVVYTRALQNIFEKEDNRYRMVHKQLYWDSPFDKDLILIQNVCPCNCTMFSRKAWDLTGNYKLDTEMTTTEDHDFWIALSRESNFEELKLIDAECSFRKDNSQMTGKLNFLPNWIITFKRWRHTAKNLEFVTQHQNNVLKQVGVNPEDYGL